MDTTLRRGSLALHTDLYQLTMAQGYWKVGARDWEAVFHQFFRRPPFKGGYTIACGLEAAIEFIEHFRFADDDLAYLATIQGNDGKALFAPDFLDYLGEMTLVCDIDAIPEGTVVFPQEPLVRVKGPLIQCQLLETPLLNLINFQTLVATKAARIARAARGEPVLEFGLRRSHGLDGGLSASRAAYVGGCVATSNVLAGKLYDIPVKGTHAHSWVMTFDTELEAFQAYARAMPNNCVFLVDTYDTAEGVRRAVEVGRWLREQGHELVGVRLDSGDLTALSIEARAILDQGGFPKAAIVASNDLDEHRITALKEQGATIAVWGVGTRLATAHDDPSLTGVYKLAAIRQDGGSWEHRIKLSEQPEKGSNPGVQQVRRYRDPKTGLFRRDLIWDEVIGLGDAVTSVDLKDPTDACQVDPALAWEDLLVPQFRAGAFVGELSTIHQSRGRAQEQLAALDQSITRRLDPGRYPVGLERRLYETKRDLARELRRGGGA
jgi:nicotinate phosphoribosyltransferase